MTVPMSLLAILTLGPCYGYQLRAEYDRRTGSAAPVNPGQVYRTLERLERDGLIAGRGSDEAGHVFYGITDAGRTRATAWLREPVDAGSAGLDALASKLALALSLPDTDVELLLDDHLVASRSAAHQAEFAARESGSVPDAARLTASARLAQANAEVAWLGALRDELARTGRPQPLPLETELPKRGRPPRSTPPLPR